MSLIRNNFTLSIKRTLRNWKDGRGWGGFHEDAIYKQLMQKLISAFPISSFVETGTSRGYSTEYIASKNPNLNVFTSEIMPDTFKTAHQVLKQYKNVTQFLGNSDECIGKRVVTGEFGSFPLFYLDAHWYDYWPLKAELEHIGRAGIKMIAVIDDFEVPGQPQFGFDHYVAINGKNRMEGKCNLEYIQPSLLVPNSFQALYPRYSVLDAFGKSAVSGTESMRGHIVVFQNCETEYDAFRQLPFANKFYFEHGDIPAASNI